MALAYTTKQLLHVVPRVIYQVHIGLDQINSGLGRVKEPLPSFLCVTMVYVLFLQCITERCAACGILLYRTRLHSLINLSLDSHCLHVFVYIVEYVTVVNCGRKGVILLTSRFAITAVEGQSEMVYCLYHAQKNVPLLP